MAQSLEHLNARRVVVGLSGGVDSAVAALLLRQAGADVHALHMTNWDDDDGYCTAAEDLQDARDVCRQLDIPLHHVNFVREYRERVFRYFLDEYSAGRTPNPDVLCNREIKFGAFREYAKRLGAEFLATGHYARVAIVDGAPVLLKGADPDKDQSYFLHAVSAAALAETVFPLGDLVKERVRALAHDHGVAVHDKKDSTGICFIGERPFREFLSSYLPASPGRIEDISGNVLGEHGGLMYYTLGQRQGLGIGGRDDARDLPWYVVGKRAGDNVLIVDQGDSPYLYSDRLRATRVSWIGAPPAEPGESLRLAAKIRYRQPDQACRVTLLSGDRADVTFDDAQRAVAPGQYVVFYAGDRCLGGGVIDAMTATTGACDPPRAAAKS